MTAAEVSVIERDYKTGPCETCGIVARLTVIREGFPLYGEIYDVCADCLEVLYA